VLQVSSTRVLAWALATADVAGVTRRTLEDIEGLAGRLGRCLAESIGVAGWQVLRYAPHGASLVGVAPRGRVIVHTWPERGELTIDLYASAADAERLLGVAVEAVTNRAASADASHE
jgi:S-adenosylmethionine/arginine decarboxylase-like enzyme